jgi:hypothetical protein
MEKTKAPRLRRGAFFVQSELSELGKGKIAPPEAGRLPSMHRLTSQKKVAAHLGAEREPAYIHAEIRSRVDVIIHPCLWGEPYGVVEKVVLECRSLLLRFFNMSLMSGGQECPPYQL